MPRTSCTIYTVGKTKHADWARLEEEYSNRLQQWMDVDVRYYKQADNMLDSAAQHQGRLVVLDETGTQYTSEEMAEWLQHAEGESIGFVIGDADGLPNEFIQSAQSVLSLSKATVTHEMARTLLLEQLYRAQSIYHNHPYHRK